MSLKTRNTLNLKLNKQDARQGGEGKTKRGQGWRDKVQTCWLSRVIGASFSLVHDVGETDTWLPEKGGRKRQRWRAVFTNSAVGKQKRGGYIYKKNKQKQIKKQGVEGSPLRKARWESGGWTTRMSITTCTKKPHTDPRVLAMASESDTNLMFAAKKKQTNKTKQPGQNTRRRCIC